MEVMLNMDRAAIRKLPNIESDLVMKPDDTGMNVHIKIDLITEMDDIILNGNVDMCAHVCNKL